MSGHTPGPWSIVKAQQPDNTGGWDYAIIDSEPKVIAEAFQNVGVGSSRPAHLNAALIAAAPDLYAAAVSLVGAIQRHGVLDEVARDWACVECKPYSDMLEDGFRCGYHATQAAIAKAEGRSS